MNLITLLSAHIDKILTDQSIVNLVANIAEYVFVLIYCILYIEYVSIVNDDEVICLIKAYNTILSYSHNNKPF